MEKLSQLIIDVNKDDIKIIENLDLNNLFNLTYSFNALKNTIGTLVKNQENFQKKFEKVLEINNEQNKYMEYLEKLIKDNYTTKEESNILDKKINELDKKIAEIDEELTKSNYIIINILFI